jgi:hypothetical protein
MKPLKNPLIAAILAIFILSATPRHLYAQEEQEGAVDTRHERVNNWEGDWKDPVHPFSSLIAPKEQLPPYGECRIWLPGKAPADQPAPLACASASYAIPPGAWVITHSGEYYTVEIYDRKKKNTIAQVRRYQLR